MFSLSPKWIFAGIATVGMGVIITLGYNHYTGMQERIVVLEKSNAELQLAVEVAEETSKLKDAAILEWQIAAEEATLESERLADVARRATSEARRLNAIFAEHDFTRLTLAKPGLIERRVNSGTARALRMLECASRGGCDAGSSD